MPTDTYMYPTKEMRDLAWETERARGSKGITRRTDQIDGKMVYILSVPYDLRGKRVNSDTPTETEKLIADFEQNATLDLTDNENGANMTNEGSPNV